MAKKKKGTLFGKPRGQVVKRPGAFRKKAQAAGKTTAEYARSVLKPGSKADTRTKRQASLAKAFGTMRKKKGGGRRSGSDNPNRAAMRQAAKNIAKKTPAPRVRGRRGERR